MKEGAIIDGYFPAVVEHELYARAGWARAARRAGGGGRKGELISNLFTGVAQSPDRNS